MNFNLKPLTLECVKGLFFYIYIIIMPCITNGWDEEATRRDNVKLIGDYEAIFCAVLTELQKNLTKDEFTSFIEIAGKNGDCDVKGFWLKHSKEDEERLKRDLSRYYKHKLSLLNKILNDEQ